MVEFMVLHGNLWGHRQINIEKGHQIFQNTRWLNQSKGEMRCPLSDTLFKLACFVKDPDYLVWLPEDPLDDSTAWMITSQKRHTDFLCPYCVKPMHVYSDVPNHLRTCPCCQKTVTELNPYRCPGNENHQNGPLCRFHRCSPRDLRLPSAEDNGHPLEHDSPS